MKLSESDKQIIHYALQKESERLYGLSAHFRNGASAYSEELYTQADEIELLIGRLEDDKEDS